MNLVVNDNGKFKVGHYLNGKETLYSAIYTSWQKAVNAQNAMEKLVAKETPNDNYTFYITEEV